MGEAELNMSSRGDPSRQTSVSDSTTDFEDDGQKRFEFAAQPAVNPATQSALHSSSPIIYHYLTFETLIPSPTSNVSSDGSSATAPPRPQLKKYTSPFDWPESRKRFTVFLSCMATMLTAYTAGAYSPAVKQMSEYWHVSDIAILAGITTFCFGFAIAPMALAPFSELNGRKPIFIASGLLFFITQICCAVTRSYPGMLVARFFVGCGSSVFSTMVGGVISDIHHKEGRNTSMSLFSGAALFGTGFGPLVSGFIAQNTSWRWVFWVQVITNGLLLIAITLFFPETRGSILLSRKAKCLNKWYEEREEAGFFGIDMPTSASGEKYESQRIRWKVKSDEERESLLQMIKISVYRPFHLLFTESVVFFFSLWVAFAWAVLYLTFGSVPLVFETSHGFNLQQSGAVFAAMSIGATISTFISIYQEQWLVACLKWSSNSAKSPGIIRRKIDLSSPEARLYFACFQSALLPIGLFWFGWTQFSSIPWIVPTLAIGCATMGIYSIYLATFNYLADTYHRYASSALAAQSFCRNILGGIFPLIATIMFNNITFQGAASLLGGIGALLTIVPWVLTIYGPTIRLRSKFASEIM
ncbi:hypothetical protein BELL_0027g00130 [Botrytis elliptica]|uniref:Major facilitator superfamily (MFS) profile domain-containing protein n=1 Tax=Botrytis elliptica TaxID=278938 RepID=A0A4Z1K7U2_9HELO|nr:hypothetical protein EAE99_001797 [Botrytis elliptica]TGO79622.1 hypothetical protein BELL_0027g00130 [Botrytis elliptica]